MAGKLLKTGKVVILTSGRFAGKKAVILKQFAEGAKERKYGHCIVAGVEQCPLKVTKAMSEKKRKNRTKVVSFVKVVNNTHCMPTRYSVDSVSKIPHDVADPTKKRMAVRKANAFFQARVNNGNHKWFFTKLRF